MANGTLSRLVIDTFIAPAVIFTAVTFGVAILRYRLWDIDLVIRRTLIYGTLTALLVLIFFGSVVLLQLLLRQFMDAMQNYLVTVLSTLVVAALFTPLRQRVQNRIDDRFYRVRILFLAANPIATDRLRLDEEVRTIDERLHEAKFRSRFDLVQHWAVRLSDLDNYLLRHTPNIVHFAGHGSATGEIVLEDERGEARMVPPATLAQLFRILKGNVRCVVLNACLSVEQAQAIAEEIECVVGMTTQVGDQAAVLFASGFYTGLGYGYSVHTAFELGSNKIGMYNLDEEAKPKLFVKPGASAYHVIFV